MIHKVNESEKEERERERERNKKLRGCYPVMHGLVIATIQPAYKWGILFHCIHHLTRQGNLRFIALEWIADSPILRFVLIYK